MGIGKDKYFRRIKRLENPKIRFPTDTKRSKTRKSVQEFFESLHREFDQEEKR